MLRRSRSLATRAPRDVQLMASVGGHYGDLEEVQEACLLLAQMALDEMREVITRRSDEQKPRGAERGNWVSHQAVYLLVAPIRAPLLPLASPPPKAGCDA